MFYILFFSSWIFLNVISLKINNKRYEVQTDESPIKLGDFKPTCGGFNNEIFSDLNTGIKLNEIKTFLTFGDSWTDLGNQVGGTPLPPLKPKASCPFYGGRPTNGKMWSEWLTELLGNGAEVKNYAVSGAKVDNTLWHSADKSSDMAMEIDRFLCQKNNIDSSSSIATLFFGNNDFVASTIESNDLSSLAPSAKKFLSETERLINAGLTNFLILTPAFDNSKLKEFNTIIWNGLKDFKNQDSNLQFITVDLSKLYREAKTSPKTFGYHSADSCLPKNSNMAEACTDPQYRLYWIFWHPQTFTHKLQAEYIKLVAESCQSNSQTQTRSQSNHSKRDNSGSPTNLNSKSLGSSNDQLNCNQVDLVPHPPKCL